MATYVGVAEAAARRAIDQVGSRVERPDIAPQIGSMLNRLTAAQDTVAAMIRSSDNLRFDNTIEAAATVLSRKTNAAEACLETVRGALEVGGGGPTSGVVSSSVCSAMCTPRPIIHSRRPNSNVSRAGSP